MGEQICKLADKLIASYNQKKLADKLHILQVRDEQGDGPEQGGQQLDLLRHLQHEEHGLRGTCKFAKTANVVNPWS